MSPDGSPRAHALSTRSVWLDRGATSTLLATDLPQPGLGFVVASRSASVGVEDGIGSFWLVLRGGAHVTSRDGRFWLGPGAWIAFGKEARHFPSHAELAEAVRQELDAEVTVLVKGSRSMQMEQVVKALLADGDLSNSGAPGAHG